MGGGACFSTAFEVVLPVDECENEEDADDEAGDDVCPNVRVYVSCVEGDETKQTGVQGVFHCWGASSPSPNTKVISTSPTVINAAPIQSTLLSVSCDGTSAGMETSPPRKQRTVMPETKKNGERQVAL